MREESSSLPAAGHEAAVFRHPPQRGHPATPREQTTATAESSSRASAQRRSQTFLRDSVPGARKRHPNLPHFVCADLRFAPPFSFRLTPPLQGWGTPPLALAAPAGVGQGQGVFVSKHSTAIQSGGTTPSLYLKIEHEPYMALVIEDTEESGPTGFRRRAV